MRSEGVLAADSRPLVRLSITVIAEQNGRREMGSSGGGGRYNYAYFDDALLEQYASEAVASALVNLDSRPAPAGRSEEHTSELQSLMRISYAVFCLKKKKKKNHIKRYRMTDQMNQLKRKDYIK